MLSVLFKQRLRMCDEEGNSLSPSDVLSHINTQLSDDVLTQGLFLTASYVLLDPKTGEMRVASAGHTPMLLMRGNGEHVLLKRTGPALGIVEVADFTEHRLNLQKGDRLILYTDGLIDGLDSVDDDEIVSLLRPALTGASRDGPERLRSLYRDVESRARRSANVGGRDDVTLLMLEAESGPCSFDNDPPEESLRDASKPAVATVPASILWIAEAEAETHLSVRGQGTWLHCENFRRLAQGSLDSGRRLAIDLTHCTHLDSAFLGTLHDIVASNAGADTSVCGPSAAICGLFAELGLGQVLEAVLDDPGEPPCEPVPVTQDPPERASQHRLLRAHEILSELSDENRERFETVVKLLRAELSDSV
jgi:anti-anti-sigma regulatory factor